MIYESFNIKGLLERYGVKQEAFTSGDHKDILSYGRDVTDEERRIVQSILDENFDAFRSLVESNRTIPAGKKTEVFDGRILSAKQALAAGLVDSVGYEEDAFAEIQELADVSEDFALVSYGEPFALIDLISGFGYELSSKTSVVQEATSALNRSPQAMYLWR